jgi:putative SOS response-associated peptidase YedK
MCGRFARKSTQEVLADWFGVELEDMPWFAPSFNVAPQSVQPVVRLNRDAGNREFALMRWGLVPAWAKDAKFGYNTINARAEEVASKPAFREAFKKRRHCLIPADSFYEWMRVWMPSQSGRLQSRSRARAIRLRRIVGFHDSDLGKRATL